VKESKTEIRGSCAEVDEAWRWIRLNIVLDTGTAICEVRLDQRKLT